MDPRRGVVERVLATAGLMLATMMNSLDTTIANVALPHIQGSLSASQDQITWMLTSYIVGTAIMTPLGGWLSLKIGRKPMFLISIGAFVAASVLCGMASSLPEMVLFRLLQGCAGAIMAPVSQAAMLDLWSREAMPAVMAVWSTVIMVGPIIGPTLGGFLTENYSWRWVFYINVPVGGLSLLLLQIFLSSDKGGRERPFDGVGFAALVLFTGAGQLLADRGPGLDWFSSREIWVEAVVAACALYVFVVQMLTAEHPFFARNVIADRNFVIGVIFNFFVSGMLFSTAALLPSFMQNLLGYTALQSGVTSMYRGFGAILAFTVVPGIARRLGTRPTVALGLLLSAWSLWRMGHFDLSMTAAPIETAGFFQGLGMGLMFNPIGVLMFLTMDADERTEAAVFSNVVRTMGGSLGIAVLQAILLRQSATAHERLAAHIVASDPVIRWSLPQALQNAAGLESVNAEVTRQGAMISYDAIFSGMAVAALTLMPLLLLLRPANRAPPKLVELQLD